MRLIHRTVSILVVPSLLVLSACASKTSTTSKPVLNAEDAKLELVIKTYSDAAKRIDAYGAPYFNVEEDLGKFGDYLAPEQRERSKKLVEGALNGVLAIQPAKLSAGEAIAYTLFRSDMEKSLKDYALPLELFSFDQMGNRLRTYIDDASPELTSFPFDTLAHYRAFIQRSEGFPDFVARQIANLKEGAKEGYALNCTIAKAAAETYKDALEPVVEKNPFYRPILKMPTKFSKAEQDEITVGFKNMIADRILPGFQRFDRFYRNEYMKLCRKSYGLSKVPRGAELYRNAIRGSTDLELDPRAIHQTGLKEVKRIKKELIAALKKLGYKGPLRESLIALKDDPNSYFTDTKSMFDAYAVYRLKVEAALPSVFSLIPKTDFKIVAGENPEDAAGRYNDPTDFLPYGRFIINGQNLKGTAKWGIDTLFLHETIPGHHFQLALQYEMKDRLSEYQRKMFFSNAFVEGWALYAERLGREIGLVSEPDQMVGSLSDEMLRAVRLVVDTGIHHFGWSRAKVIQYMTENLASDARGIQIEADRYSVWPGQALGYKIGQLKILELRERAKKELGPKFDIKEFHRTVLGSGTLSLPVLESKVVAWIETTKRG
ncbi:DUF885 domain-containing protein [soil metagenome]